MFHLVNSADLARSIDSEKRSNIYNLTRDFGYFKYTLNEIKNLREYILSDYNDWSYCSSSSIVTENVIPVWIFDPSPHIEKFNFYDEVGIFLKHGNNLVNMIAQNKTYSNVDARFFGLNSFGYTFEFTHGAMSGLVDCEVNRVKETDTKITALIFVGLGLLAIFTGILIGYSILMARSNDNFWNFVNQSSQISFFYLRESCLERLSEVHGVNYSKDNNIENHYPKIKRYYRKIHSKLYIKYIWRISIFLAIASCYYFTLKFSLYDQCETYLINRPKLLLNLLARRVLLSRMSVFARDIGTSSYLRWIPNSYGLASSKLEFSTSSEEFKLSNHELRSKDFLKLLSDDLKTGWFETIRTDDYYLHLGTYVAANIIYMEAKYISVTPANIGTVIAYSNYIGNETALQETFGVNYDIVDQDSKDTIKSELYKLIYMTVIFSSALILLYIFFYHPFIYSEKCWLSKLKLLMSIIKNSDDLISEKL
ncbi:unnamed protein product [Blepharisma stoltei]|uniref:Uncharacterized protein n=1 Tax=Blepharisma stoltei TaxID=1481888 RepID=A0AAU9JAH6_9CILI|nr:unnamed protein product [Blepharisma stoltei]